MSIREEIAKNMLYYRKRAGLSQIELAAKLGVKNTSVSNWERGENTIAIETLFNACEIFGVTLNDMYGKYAVPELSDDERRLVDSFRMFNDEGKEKVLAYVADLTQTGIYKKYPVVSMGKEA